MLTSEIQLLDSIFYEVDVETSNVLFRWSPLDHLDEFDSLANNVFGLSKKEGRTPIAAWDYLHMNSIARVPDPMGGYFLSARPLSALFKLDDNGNFEWVIGVSTVLGFPRL